MPKKSAQKLKVPPSDLSLYLRTLIAGAITFGLTYGYTSAMGIPNVINKSAADTAILLMGFSMLLSSLCYFWNFFDHLIVYRKHLGLIGFAFGIAHIALSFSMLTGLLQPSTWQNGAMWPGLTGVIATVIFTVMAIVSDRNIAMLIGGKLWRPILRTGYIAVIFIWLHVVLLKSGRWITWYNGGMKTLPSMSLLVTIFMVIVLVMRILLEVSIRGKKKRA